MGTYDYFKSHPLRVKNNHRTVTIGQMLLSESHQTENVTKVHPSAGAYIHYGGVELADKLVILQPSLLGDELETLMVHWNASCGFVCRHLLTYVWRIIAKEQRHGSHAMCAKAFGPVWDKNPYQALVGALNAKGNYPETLDKVAHLSIGPYVDAIETHYRKGGWSGAFGGKKWADIAAQLQLYINGEASAMIAADRCWTLVHNTGPIFNKGFYFHHHGSGLMKVLNAQAKTSVFDVTFDPYKGDPHPAYAAFEAFKELATKIIQRADPGYTPGKGATGANFDPTSQGTKDDLNPNDFMGTIALGGFLINTIERDNSDD